MVLAAYAGRLFFCGGAETVVRLSALRLPSFRMIPKSAVAVFGKDHAGKKGGTKGFLKA